MATTIIKSTSSDNQAIVTSDGRLLVSGDGSTGSNASVGTTGATAPTQATEIAGVDPSGNLKAVAVDSAGNLIIASGGGGTQDVVESGTVDTAFGDITSVPMNTLTTIVSYTAGGPTRVKFCEVSGTNIATYTISVNGSPVNRKQTFYGNLDNDFQFSKGYALVITDIITITVIHQQTSVGEFSGFVLVLKDY